MTDSEPKRSVIQKASLPDRFPTHMHAARFWEELGRVVGTFGLLEEVLGKAIFALTGTVRVDEASASAALEHWQRTLEHALTDPLGPLIDSFGRAVRAHPEATSENLDDLLKALRQASQMRNALCHGSWQPPDHLGRSKPLFVNKKLLVFDSLVDDAFLRQTQTHAAELVCEVMNTITHMGYQFPGSDGPGRPVW